MPPNLRSVIAQRYYLGGRSIRNFCSTPPPVSSNETNGGIKPFGWFVSRCIGVAVGYGIGTYMFGGVLRKVTEKKEAKLRKDQEQLEQLEKMLFSKS